MPNGTTYSRNLPGGCRGLERTIRDEPNYKLLRTESVLEPRKRGLEASKINLNEIESTGRNRLSS
jgi:hypothetical protein